MKNLIYHPAGRARRQRLAGQLTVVWRLVLLVAVNFSVWIIAEDFEHKDSTPSVTFTPLPADIDRLGSQGRPLLVVGEPETADFDESGEATADVEIEEGIAGELEPDESLDRVAVASPELPALSFLRPGWTSATDRYRPSRESDEDSRKGLRVHFDTGYGNDSSTLQREAGQSTAHRNGYCI